MANTKNEPLDATEPVKSNSHLAEYLYKTIGHRGYNIPYCLLGLVGTLFARGVYSFSYKKLSHQKV
jgi:hypothetical protein